MTYIPTTSRHQDAKTIEQRIAGVNKQLKQKAELYWIHTEEMTDPKSEGYVGVTKIDNKEARFKELKDDFVASGFLESTDELRVTQLMTGTYGEMNAQEAVFRPYLGVGWNYCNGGGAVFSMAYLNPKNWVKWGAK